MLKLKYQLTEVIQLHYACLDEQFLFAVSMTFDISTPVPIAAIFIIIPVKKNCIGFTER